MAWQTDMRPGALNGVPIAVVRRRKRGGRHTALHEFSGGDLTWSEDTGQLPDRFSVSFKVIGDDYIIDRDRVLAILEAAGPYMYTDPTFGDVSVALDGPYELDEGFDGVADFEVPFHRATPLAFPIVPRPSAALKAVAILAPPAIVKGFKLPFSLFKAILRALGKLNQILRVAKGKISSKLGLLDSLANELSQLSNNLRDLMNTPDALANAIKRVVANVIGLVKVWKDSKVPKVPDALGFDSGNAAGLAVLMETVADFRDAEIEIVDTTTPEGVEEQANLVAVDALFKQLVFASAAEVLADVPPDTADAAVEIKETMAGFADDMLSNPAIDPDAYDAIADVAAAVTDYQVTVGQDLPNERIFLANKPIPAPVISQIIFKTGNHDEEITGRNQIRHPLFCTGEIKVIAP